MRNVFFALVLMLIGTFGFASSDEIELANEDDVIENVNFGEETTLEDTEILTIAPADVNPSAEDHCEGQIDVSLSCGVSFYICGYSGSTSRLLSAIWFLEDFICGGTIQT